MRKIETRKSLINKIIKDRVHKLKKLGRRKATPNIRRYGRFGYDRVCVPIY